MKDQKNSWVTTLKAHFLVFVFLLAVFVLVSAIGYGALFFFSGIPGSTLLESALVSFGAGLVLVLISIPFIGMYYSIYRIFR